MHEKMHEKQYRVGQRIRFLARKDAGAPEVAYTGHVLQVAHVQGELAYVVSTPIHGMVVPWQKVIGRVRTIEVVEPA